MSSEERADFRDRMQAAQTVEERQRICTEQRAMLEERAAAQGATLADSPCMSGQRFDRGANPGMGGMRGMGGGPAAKHSRLRLRVNLPATFRIKSLWALSSQFKVGFIITLKWRVVIKNGSKIVISRISLDEEVNLKQLDLSGNTLHRIGEVGNKASFRLIVHQAIETSSQGVFLVTYL